MYSNITVKLAHHKNCHAQRSTLKRQAVETKKKKKNKIKKKHKYFQCFPILQQANLPSTQTALHNEGREADRNQAVQAIDEANVMMEQMKGKSLMYDGYRVSESFLVEFYKEYLISRECRL